MDKVVLKIFQKEVERQCKFALIAHQGMNQALQERERLGHEMDQRFEKRAREEMKTRARTGEVPRGPVVVAMHNEFGDWWERHDECVDRFWYSVQSLLGAAGNVSKLLWPSYRKGEKLIPERAQELRKSLSIGREHSVLEPRTFRDHFEHYDARLEEWATSSKDLGLHDVGIRASEATGNVTAGGHIVSGSGDPGGRMREFDATTETITFRGDSYQLQPIIEAIQCIRQRAKVEAERIEEGA